jgi:hypothetical protein
MANNTAVLTWILPTEREDGSPLPIAEIQTVTIFDGANEIGQTGAVTTFTTGTLGIGPHTFDVKITDVFGLTSVASNSASVTVPSPSAPPKPATNLTAVLQ